MTTEERDIVKKLNELIGAVEDLSLEISARQQRGTC